MAESTDKRSGFPVRSCARIVRHPDGYVDTSNVFIAGNAIELVPAGRTEGETHTFSRIFDVHASDTDVYDAEVVPLLQQLVAGTNVNIVVAGNHRAGHASLVNKLVPLIVDSIFDQMQQRQAVAGGQGARLSYQLHASAGAVVIGSADKMSDMLTAGSSELRIVRDAEAPNGVRLPGVHRQKVGQGTDFAKMFGAARQRVAQQHKPPTPSNVLVLELTQTSSRGAQPAEELVSQLVLADIEVGNLGDPLASAVRTVVSAAPTRPPPHAGAALLLADAFGGNGHTLFLGCVMPVPDLH